MIKKIFIQGLKAFIPVALTLAIVIWTFNNIETLFGHFIQYFIPQSYYFDGLGILIGIVCIFLVGFLVNAWVIKNIYQLLEKMVKRIPLINTIYSSIQDLVNFFEKAQQTEANQAVLISFGKNKVIGFITRDSFEGLPEAFGTEKDVLVYIPLSYQIGGLMLSIPRKRITPIDMKVNKAMSLIITAGMTGAEEKKVKV